MIPKKGQIIEFRGFKGKVLACYHERGYWQLNIECLDSTASWVDLTEEEMLKVKLCEKQRL